MAIITNDWAHPAIANVVVLKINIPPYEYVTGF